MRSWLQFLCKFRLTGFVRKAILFLFVLYSPRILSQTTDISGIVNTYHSLVEVVDAATIRVDNVTGLAYGNMIMIVQMRGATVETANNSSFGNVTNMNNAGFYEIATICGIGGDTLYLFHELVNNYTPTAKTQIVRFAEYYSARVTAAVKPASWDSTTGKGGVLAIRVEEDLILNGPVFADSTGYRGGAFLMHSGTCVNGSPATNYAYDGNNTGFNGTGAFKGEGIGTFTATQDGGKGAFANGGGGGNNHNNGGAGGGNLSAGGDGGGNYATVAGACTGAADRTGLGGKALNSSGGTRIFMGGGGGAGNVNNNVPTHGGGHGGGIIFIMARNVTASAAQKISANGRVGGLGGSDGASGGGAGGTIIMHVTNNYTGPITIEANGGNGGTINNQNIANRCYGAGGGGSGGVIYFNGTTPAITAVNVTPGGAGPQTGVNGCAAATPILADPGIVGSTVQNYDYITSVDASNVCDGMTLPVQLISFTARLTTNEEVKLNWQVDNIEDAKRFTIEKLHLNEWKTIIAVNPVDHVVQYEAVDPLPTPGDNIYRLRISEKSNRVTYSTQRKVMINRASFTIYPNPAKDNITVTGRFDAGTLLQLTDISGKTLKEKVIASNAYTVDFILPALPAGVYLLKAGSTIEKLVIR
jgi:hypothetical protein